MQQRAPTQRNAYADLASAIQMSAEAHGDLPLSRAPRSRAELFLSPSPAFPYYTKYADHYRDPIFEPSKFEGESSSETDKKLTAFPDVLYKMLNDAESQGFGHICSWQEHGRSFRVEDEEEFVAKVMPKYFTSSLFASFKRQLNLYDFCRLTRGQERGAYYHAFLLRGRPDLCRHIKRTRIKSTARPSRQPRPPVLQPDFSKFEVCRALDPATIEELKEKAKIERETRQKERLMDSKLYQALHGDPNSFRPQHSHLGYNPEGNNTFQAPPKSDHAGRSSAMQDMLWQPLPLNDEFHHDTNQSVYQSQDDSSLFHQLLQSPLLADISESGDSIEPRPLPQDAPVAAFGQQHDNGYIVRQSDYDPYSMNRPHRQHQQQQHYHV